MEKQSTENATDEGADRLVHRTLGEAACEASTGEADGRARRLFVHAIVLETLCGGSGDAAFAPASARHSSGRRGE